MRRDKGKVVEQRVYSIGEGDADSLKVLARRIGRDLKADRIKMRPLPRVAVELGRIASSTDPEIARAMEVIQRDTQLATKVLQVASSSAFGTRPPRSLHEASMRLGVTGLRDLAFAVSMAGVFRCPGLDGVVRTNTTHGFVTAVLTGYVCRMMKLDANEGFLAGLLHDVGNLVVATALSEYGREDKQYWDPALAKRLGRASHARLGAYLLERWGFSKAVRDVALGHHRPDDAAEPLAIVVAMADHVADIDGATEEERAQALAADPCQYGPALSDAHVAALAHAAHLAHNDPVLQDMAA